MPFIDDGIWGDGDIYFSDSTNINGYIARQEAHTHYVALRLNYTATLIPGAVESFRVIRMALRNALDRQGSFTHEAFIDVVESTDHVAMRLTHSGSEFTLRHCQLIMKPRRAQIRG